MAAYIIIAIIAYAIGSINFSVILSRKMAGRDFPALLCVRLLFW